MINGDIAIINTSYENCSRIVLESMLQDIHLSIRKGSCKWLLASGRFTMIL